MHIAISKSPKLRFPNFRDAWQRKALKDISTIITSGSRDWAQFYSDSGAKFIRMTNLSRGEITLNLDHLKYVTLPDNHSEGSRTSLRSNDILISITAELGKIGFVPNDIGEAYINQHTALMRINQKLASPMYIAYQLARKPSNDQLNRLNDSGAKAGLNLKTIQSFSLMMPDIAEQIKIADFLSALDKKIAIQRKKVKLLRKYKGCVTHNIFNQQVRFKDEMSNTFPKWQEVRLGNFFDRVVTKNMENNQNVLTISAKQGLVNQQTYFNKSVAAKNLAGYYLLKHGDFAYNKSYSSGYPMGAIKRLNTYDKGVVSTLYICFRPKVNTNSEYFMQVFDAGLQNRGLSQVTQEGARNHGLLNIAIKDFFNVKLPIPSEAEQQRIADFLSILDDKIKLEESKLEKVIHFKNALLQQMFV